MGVLQHGVIAITLGCAGMMLHGCGGSSGGGGSSTTPAPAPAANGSWVSLGEGCCGNMMAINPKEKVFDQNPKGSCLDKCETFDSALAVKFPNDGWCTCLASGYNVSNCSLPLCAAKGCCGSSGVGVYTYVWI